MDGNPSADDLKIPTDMLRTFLSGRDVPCPQCEYNLRDLAGNRCPECGEAIVLRVNLSDHKQRLLIAGLVGLSAGAGLNWLLVIYVFIQILSGEFFAGGQLERRFFKSLGMGLVVEGIAIVLWLMKWRRIRQASLGARIILVMACWTITFVDIAWLSFAIR